MLKLKIGNRKVYDYRLKIDGEAPTLGDVTAGSWMIKKDQTDSNEDAVVKVVFDPITPSEVFLLDTPDVGWVRVIVVPSKTQNVPPGRYYFALQLEWGEENKQEFTFDDGMIELIQDTIR